MHTDLRMPTHIEIATHNKGIMNGIDPALATGKWRAIEAGAHMGVQN